jgi:putative addiction module killer protein
MLSNATLSNGNIYGTKIMTLSVLEYIRPDGTSPFRIWFDRLPAQPAAKVAVALARLAAGNAGNVKRIGAIAEYRIDWGPGYRLYLGRDGDAVVIMLGGGTKKRQQRDIA